MSASARRIDIFMQVCLMIEGAVADI